MVVVLAVVVVANAWRISRAVVSTSDSIFKHCPSLFFLSSIYNFLSHFFLFPRVLFFPIPSQLKVGELFMSISCLIIYYLLIFTNYLLSVSNLFICNLFIYNYRINVKRTKLLTLTHTEYIYSYMCMYTFMCQRIYIRISLIFIVLRTVILYVKDLSSL